MAYANTSHIASASIIDRMIDVLEAVKTVLVRRAVFKQTVCELNKLSARELADLGIHRSMIHRLAQEAAYGK